MQKSAQALGLLPPTPASLRALVRAAEPRGDEGIAAKQSLVSFGPKAAPSLRENLHRELKGDAPRLTVEALQLLGDKSAPAGFAGSGCQAPRTKSETRRQRRYCRFVGICCEPLSGQRSSIWRGLIELVVINAVKAGRQGYANSEKLTTTFAHRSPACLKLPASADCDQRGGEPSSTRCLRDGKRWIPEDLPELGLSQS